jgi:hypothetical protein
MYYHFLLHKYCACSPYYVLFYLDFLINGLERRVGIGLNSDGYIGGEGKIS